MQKTNPYSSWPLGDSCLIFVRGIRNFCKIWNSAEWDNLKGYRNECTGVSSGRNRVYSLNRNPDTGIAFALVHNICLWLVFIVRFSISNERKNRLSADSGVAFTDRLVAGKTFLDVSCGDGLFDNRGTDDPFILCLA